MASTPVVSVFDNNYVESLSFYTNSQDVFIHGIIDSNAVDVQVSIDGGQYTSDSSLVKIDGTSITVPNPDSFQDGYELHDGSNEIKIRSIDINGSASQAAVVSINYISSSPTMYYPPSGVYVKRNSNDVEVFWSITGNVSKLVGFNVYASTLPGGLGSGYLKLNLNTVPSDSIYDTKAQYDEIDSISYTSIDTTNGYLNIKSSVSSLINPTNETTKTINSIDVLDYSAVKLDVTVSETTLTNVYRFVHDRSGLASKGILNSDTFDAVNTEDDIYYVVTALYKDSNNNVYESAYSIEISGKPLNMDSTIVGIDIRSDSDISTSYIQYIQSTNPELSLIPGSTIREIHIEPLANEVQKVYFLADFVHRSKSFHALLQIDDPNRTGQSIPVDNSQYKISLRNALNTSDNVAVQTLIDAAFSSLSENFGVTRGGKTAASVIQTFYTTTRPTKDIKISVDTIVGSSSSPQSPRFYSKGVYYMYYSDIDSYYNSDEDRYEIDVEMYAEWPGSSGNLPAGAIDSVLSNDIGFKTVNKNAAYGGADEMTNTQLAEAAMRKLTSLDTGTIGGYMDTAASVPGVTDVIVVESGSDYMMRDWDEVRGKHIGGKVDVYVRGSIDRTITQMFAFKSMEAKSMRFDVIDPVNLIFRSFDTNLNSNNTIVKLISLTNNTVSSSYDIVGYKILDYNTIQLSSTVSQPVTTVDDFVVGNYLYSVNKYIPTIQPIERIVSLTGEITGQLEEDIDYKLYKSEDLLLLGGSTKASDYVSVTNLNSQQIHVSDESHVLVDLFEQPLGKVGVDVSSVVVTDSGSITTYKGYGYPDPDYEVDDTGNRVTIRRTVGSAIPNGSTVLISYDYNENFVIEYVVNDVVQRVDDEIQKMRHTTADVVVKSAFENYVDLACTVILRQGASKSEVDSQIRTELTTLSTSRKIGEPIYQSDIIGRMENVTGVDFIVQPLQRFTLGDGSMRFMETVMETMIYIPQLSKYNNKVYMSSEPLIYSTVEYGSNDGQFSAVYVDDIMMTMVTNLNKIGESNKNCYISGSDGVTISGYSGDTSNRAFISINDDDEHEYRCTYVIYGDTQTIDIDTSDMEYIVPGNVSITYTY